MNQSAVEVEYEVIPGSEEIQGEDQSPPIPLEDDDDAIVQQAKQHFKLAEEAEQDIRSKALEDLNFRVGNQWPQNIMQDRDRDGRPCLVINRLPQFVQQITNDQRQNRPGIKVHPVSDGANQATAKVIQGLIRHIEYSSNAEAAYDTAFESAVTSSFGYFRVITAFSRPDSFDQELLIKRIRNPMSVFFDPYSQEPDGSDAKWAMIVDDLSKADFRNQFPGSRLASETDWVAIGNQQPGWVMGKGETVRVAEYFCIKYKKEKIYLLKTGEVVKQAELAERLQRGQETGVDNSVVASRIANIPVVHWYKINAIEVLERGIWPGQYIPIIPVYGAEVIVDGKKTLESLIRNAKDSQRMYNYWKSAQTETIALAPRTPWVVAEGQLEGYEAQWAEANRRNHAFLPYKPVTIGGQLAPPPQRQQFEPAVQAITQAAMLAADDLKATTGVYDAALGQQSPDASGVAIQKRTNQSLTSNFHFIDNLNRSMKHCGRILVDVIPHVYDTARTARIVQEDGTEQFVRLNQTYTDESGKEVLYSMDVGKYDVTVSTGPSFATRRQEAAASMANVTQVYPQLMGICGDLMIKNMDWPGAEEMAERIKKTLPPELQNDGKNQKIPPMVQAQMSQMQQMIQALSQQLNEASEVIKTRRMELESKERIEFAKIQADIETTLAKLGTQSSIALLQQEVAAITQRLKILNIQEPISAQDNFDPQMGAGGPPAMAPQAGPDPTGGMAPGIPMGQEPMPMME